MMEKDLWMKRFGRNLLSIIPKGMTVKEFAKLCGVDSSTMHAYISGKSCPSVWVVVKIARVLGRPITDVADYFY